VILTAAFIVAAVALLALTVDTGRLYAAQQKLQSTANLAALAAARQASGCRRDLGSGDGAAAASATLARNYPGRGDNAPTLSRYDEGFVESNRATGLRDFNVNGNPEARPNGARLTVTDTRFKPLLPAFSDQSATLTATAGALSQPKAGLKFGTSLAEVDPILLGNLLGVDLAVASAGDLATVQVSLAQLLNLDANVATREDLVSITLNEALGNVTGRASALAGGLIGAVRDALGDQPLSAILSLVGPVGSDASLALGSIVNAAAQVVAAERTQNHTIPLDIDLSQLPAGLGGLNVGLRILEPAQTEMGPAGTDASGRYYTKVRSAQVGLELGLGLEIAIDDFALARVKLPLAVQLAQGEARLESIDCPSPSEPSYAVTVSADTATAAAAIGSLGPDGGIDTGDRAEVVLLGITIAELFNRGDAQTTLSARTDQRAVFDNIEELERPLTDDGDAGLRLNDLAGLLGNVQLDFTLLKDTGFLGDLLTGLTRPIVRLALDGVTGLLQTVSAAVLAPVLDPILDALGVSLAAPSITLTGIQPSQPELFCASAEDCGFVVETR